MQYLAIYRKAHPEFLELIKILEPGEYEHYTDYEYSLYTTREEYDNFYPKITFPNEGSRRDLNDILLHIDTYEAERIRMDLNAKFSERY